MKFLPIFLIMICSLHTVAAEKPYDIRVIDPERRIAYVVGDIINRTIELDVKQPSDLLARSLPAKGLKRKGIELREVRLHQRKKSESTHYELVLSYQVFTRDVVARKVELPAETLQISTVGKPVAVHIPGWQFTLSPLANYGETYIEKEMSPYRAPSLSQDPLLEPILMASFGMMLVAVIGLTYLHADEAWFPGMGGPFAISYIRIANLPDTTENLILAATSIHEALNQTLGENVFSHNLEKLFQNKPALKSLETEITDFFALSNHLLYEMNVHHQIMAGVSDLQDFCKRCRDCERQIS